MGDAKPSPLHTECLEAQLAALRRDADLPCPASAEGAAKVHNEQGHDAEVHPPQ